MGLKCCELRAFSGKFLNYGKSAGVKVLTNIMSVSGIIINAIT